MQYQQALRRKAAVSLVAILSLVPAWAGSQDESLPNFHKVSDQVYRGAQPTRAGFNNLANLGVKTVIDLRLLGEHSQAEEQKTVTDLGMRYVSIPMHGMATPQADQVAAVEALFNDPLSGPVFVHCKRGADRTGMVVAIYRISHDRWDNKKALQEAKSYGMSFFQRALQHYVMDYRPAATLAAGGASLPSDAGASGALVSGAPAIR